MYKITVDKDCTEYYYKNVQSTKKGVIKGGRKRYRLLDEEGKVAIVKKDKDRYIGLDELAQHIAMNIVDDYQSILDGDKKIEDTNIELSVKVLTAIFPVIKTC